jgi:hypothetical protein
VRQLDAGQCPLGVQEVGDPRQAGDVLVGPQADVRMADPPVPGDRGRLHDDQPEAAEREPAQVHQVVVADQPVLDRVLAHRRDDQAVRQRTAAHGQGLEQFGGRHEMW